MRNRKPEKGPLFMSIGVAVFVLIFAIFWTVMTARFAPFMAIFGIFFVGFAIAQIVMTIHHASGKEGRSSFDSPNEQDNRYAKPQDSNATQHTAQAYCPSCGAKVEADFVYCSECGRKLPK